VITTDGMGDEVAADDSDDQAPDNNSQIVNDDTMNLLNEGELELVVSQRTSTKTTAHSVPLYYPLSQHLVVLPFRGKNAVLVIEFDNQTPDFDSTSKLVLFKSSASYESIRRWINNQHSDGVYDEYARPKVTYELKPDAVSINSSAFIETLSGVLGDVYKKTSIDFTGANASKPGSYFLNGFADQSVVYYQTQ